MMNSRRVEETGTLESNGLTRRQLLQGATAVLVYGVTPLLQAASVASMAISANFAIDIGGVAAPPGLTYTAIPPTEVAAIFDGSGGLLMGIAAPPDLVTLPNQAAIAGHINDLKTNLTASLVPSSRQIRALVAREAAQSRQALERRQQDEERSLRGRSPSPSELAALRRKHRDEQMALQAKTRARQRNLQTSGKVISLVAFNGAITAFNALNSGLKAAFNAVNAMPEGPERVKASAAAQALAKELERVAALMNRLRQAVVQTI